MNIEEMYKLWVEKAYENKDLSEELKKIENDEKEKYERFYKNLEFGTAGLRGIMAAGTNRMNIYTVRRATKGLADYLNSKYKNGAVAVSYDSRNNSEIFAIETAKVLASNGIKVYISHELQPTPVLSFCVRELKCQAGVMITASHNPAEYNGYKCYSEDGCQMTDTEANEVYGYIEKVDMFGDTYDETFEELLNSGKISFIEDCVYDKYVDCVLSQRLNLDVFKNCDLNVTYTPLNGAGNKLVKKVLNIAGVKKLSVVKEQENPDGDFPTCRYPNPEMSEALKLAIDLAKKENSDVLISTDPDSDRIGVGVRHGNEYKILSGNEIGILLLNYILESRKSKGDIPKNGIVVKTIVSSPMIDVIAEGYGCRTINVLTGFKYIGKEILKLENTNDVKRYLFGFEESHGYLVGTYVRDKDGVVANMLFCEMAAYYKNKNKNLVDVLNELYEKYGFYYNENLSFQFEGSSGIAKMQSIMDGLRNSQPKTIGGLEVLKIEDYLNSKILNVKSGEEEKLNLPKSNVLKYRLENDNILIIRPSGTEPKIKVYIQTNGKSLQEAKKIYTAIQKDASKFLNV